MPKEDILNTVYTRFKKARDATVRKEFENDLESSKRAFKGQVFTDAQVKKMEENGIPPVKVSRGTTNALRYASILTASKPELKALAKGRGDKAIATLIQRAYTKIWEENRGVMKNFRVMLGTIRDGLSHFNCWSEKYGMAGDVKIKFNKLDAKKTYYDPETTEDDMDDWRYRITAKAITKQEAKDLYGLKDDEFYYTFMEKPDQENAGTDHDSEPGGKYDDAPTGKQEDPKRTIWEIEYYEKQKKSQKLWFDKDLMKAFPRFDNLEKDNQAKMALMMGAPSETPIDQRFQPLEVANKDLIYRLVVGKKLIADIINPYKKDNLAEPVDPIIPLPNIPIGSAYPRGNMFFAIGPLEEITKRRGQSIAVVSATMGSPILAKKGTVNIADWQKKLTKPKEILEAEWDDPADKPGPLYQTMPEMSRVFMLEDRALNDLNDVFNLTPVLKGEAETGRMSGRLAAMLKEFGMEGNAYLLAAAEDSFRRLGVCLVVMALNEWPYHYWERLVEDEDKDPESGELMPQFVQAFEKLKSKDVSIIDYDIGIRSGSSLPSNRMARLDLAMELATTPLPPEAVYDREAVLSYLDDPQSEAVLKRQNDRMQMRQQIQKMGGDMQQMIEQLDGMNKDIQVKQEEIDTMKIQHVEDMGKAKWRYETTIEKMNLKLAAQKAQSAQKKPSGK
uniref:Portal protein n=1 Tax=viral metagenome TaxID=1070528 RepID=A0A6M3IJF2_9ZZZZ